MDGGSDEVRRVCATGNVSCIRVHKKVLEAMMNGRVSEMKEGSLCALGNHPPRTTSTLMIILDHSKSIAYRLFGMFAT